MTILSECTAVFSLDTLEWSKVNEDIREMGPGGELIQGQDNKLYYIGGYDTPSRNKSKAIYEFSDPGWHKWPSELMVDKYALDAWDVTAVGRDFCAHQPNITKAVSYEEGWVLKQPNIRGICVKNLFEGNSTHEEC